METDADRLAMIKSLGGQLVQHPSGSFLAIFDREFVLLAEGAVESRQPALTARTIDVADLPKDAILTVAGDTFRIKRHEPDGTGMSLVILKR
jgi:hypothetical protein